MLHPKSHIRQQLLALHAVDKSLNNRSREIASNSKRCTQDYFLQLPRTACMMLDFVRVHFHTSMSLFNFATPSLVPTRYSALARLKCFLQSFSLYFSLQSLSFSGLSTCVQIGIFGSSICPASHTTCLGSMRNFLWSKLSMSLTTRQMIISRQSFILIAHSSDVMRQTSSRKTTSGAEHRTAQGAIVGMSWGLSV